MSERPLWTPDAENIARSQLKQFAETWGKGELAQDADFGALHAASVSDAALFWSAVWDFAGIVGEKGVVAAPAADARMAEGRYFPDARLNFAENLLRYAGEDDALVFRGEDKAGRRMSRRALRHQVARAQSAMRALGIGPGDRVAAMMPNMPETVIAMLAATSLGAVWSSCSPDFGERGVLDRFGQIEPTLLIACDGYWYNGKPIDVTGKLAAIADQLPTLKAVWLVEYLGDTLPETADLSKTEVFSSVLDAAPRQGACL